ncbi:hypothetical protein Cma02nite_29530 [Cellulomonas marina]|nr:hypothetical protein Cma02nite_29530 [Cellulomonas marina]
MPGPWAQTTAVFWQGHRQALPGPLLGAAALVGTAGGAVLVDTEAGLGLTLVGLGVLACGAGVLRRPGRRADRALLGLAALLLVVATVRDAEWVVALSVLAAVGTTAVALTGARTAAAAVLAVPVAALGTLRAALAVRHSVGDLAGRRRQALRAGLRTAAVTVLLLGVFGALLASADAVFAALLPRADLGLLPARAVVGVLVGLVALAAGHLVLAPPSWPTTQASPPRRTTGEWLVPVAALDGLLVVFGLVQVATAVGCRAFVERTAGLTYAEHARSGFFQLVAVTALTLVVVAVAAHRAPRASARDRLVSRAALGLLCVATLGVVAVAVQRMTLYVDAFGLTRLRLLVLVAEGALAVVLVLVLAAGVRWRGAWLPRAAVAVVAGAVLSLGLLDADALVLRYDARADAPLDPAYLQDLSDDAVVAADALPEPLRTCLLTAAARARDLDAAGRTLTTTDDGWAAWNLGRARAAEVLGDLPAGGAGAACRRLLGGGS